MTTRWSLPYGENAAMQVRSLGFRTDLMLRRLGGSLIEERDGYLVVRTPDNPTFYWGNFLLFGQPPGANAAAGWLDVFTAEFPDAGHVAIGVDGTDGRTGDVEPLLAAGLEVEVNHVLTATALTAGPPPPEDVVARPLAADDDWVQTAELRLLLDDDRSNAHREFVERKLAETRRLVETGHGAYFGAFRGDAVVASLGIVVDDDVARYQNVETHPLHRRRGLASMLLRAAAAYAVDELGARTLVIVADPDYVAIDLYRALGFTDAERQIQLQRAG